MPYPFVRTPLIFLSLLAAAAGGASAQAEGPDCDAVQIRGVRPGMSVREVRQTMGGRATRHVHHTKAERTRTDAVYARPPYTIVVHYDGHVTRRATSARVVAVELNAARDAVDAAALAEQLIERLGAPLPASAAPFGGAEPTVWPFEACEARITAHTERGDWWNPAERGSLIVRLVRSVETPSVAAETGDAVENAASTRPQPSPAVASNTGRDAEAPETASTPAAREAPARTDRPNAIRNGESDDIPAGADTERAATAPPESSAPKTPGPEPDPAASDSSAPSRASTGRGSRGDLRRDRPRSSPSADGPFAALGERRERAPQRLDSSYVEPRYPVIARRMGATAEVELQIVVRQDGSVGDIVIARSSRPGLGFEDAAIEAVRAWRYRPALRRGRAIDAPLNVVVSFR